MDPAAAIGLIGSVVGTADVLAKSIRTLLDLQSKYKTADLKVSTLIGQLSILKAALGHIANMMNETMAVTQYGQFFGDLSTSLQGCEAMITTLDARLSNLERNDANGLTVSAKVNLIWDDATMTEYLNILNNQINALHLLLSALQCRSMLELQESASRRIFDRVKDDTSSLLWLRDADSLSSHGTASTQNVSNLNAEFDFDREILASKVYRNVIRSNMITAIQTSARQNNGAQNDTSRPPSISSQFRLSRTFSIHSERLPDVETTSSPSLLTPRPQDQSLLLNSLLPPVMGRVNIFSWHEEIDNKGIQSKISSSTFGESSIFRFQRRRHLVPSSTQLSIAPKQAPGSSMNILILGTSQSGKSTMIKSLMASFGCYDLDTRRSYRGIINSYLKETLSMLSLDIADSTPEDIFSKLRLLSHEREEVRRKEVKRILLALSLQRFFDGEDFDPELRAHISMSWNNALVHPCKESYRMIKNSIYLNNSSAEDFIDILFRNSKKDYVPSMSDILRSYVKSTGISVSHFEADGKSYNFFDVGGAPSERRKWHIATANKDTLMYTFDVACYGKPSEGDPDHDAMREQFSLWENLVSGKELSKTRAIVIIFTKTDLLSEDYIVRLSTMEDMPRFEPNSGPDVPLQALATKILALAMKDSGDEDRKARRKITFWRTSIASAVAEPAEVILTALEQLDEG